MAEKYEAGCVFILFPSDDRRLSRSGGVPGHMTAQTRMMNNHFSLPPRLPYGLNSLLVPFKAGGVDGKTDFFLVRDCLCSTLARRLRSARGA